MFTVRLAAVQCGVGSCILDGDGCMLTVGRLSSQHASVVGYSYVSVRSALPVISPQCCDAAAWQVVGLLPAALRSCCLHQQRMLEFQHSYSVLYGGSGLSR
jgi:hypothetical protein